MVQWKGDTGDEAGRKAQLLDQLEGFNIPNFFVIKPDEIKRLFNGEDTSEGILNTSINRGIKREIKEAYEEVGMSSEVREASGRAKNLVGGQRNNQFVSVRVSDSEKEKYTYKLNVGSSSFFESLREVVSSYCKKNSDYPAVIVQKMVEPDYTGTLETQGRETVIETVNGLGISLEEGLTVPHVYHLRNSQLQKTITADEQLEISRNPVRGGNKRQKVKDDEEPFSQQDVEELAQKASRRDINLKFVYKRGGFHIVDAYQPSEEEGFIVSKKGIRASRGEITGNVGREVVFNDQTLPPQEYDKALISRKGGYTSRDGYRARKAEKPAVFRFSEELRNGQEVRLGSAEVEVQSKTETRARNRRETRENSVTASVNTSSKESKSKSEQNPFRTEETGSENLQEEVLASEVLPIDPRTGRGVCLKRNSDTGYVITDRNTEAEKIPESGYLSSFEDIFAFEGDRAVVDSRRLPERGLESAIEYFDADLKILLMQESDREVLQAAVNSGFDVYAAPKDSLDEVSKVIEAAEKKFIMKRLREL